ncbi:hypothetical protein CPB85DRAFT_1312106 [Mucidula mucida]|nr:hypothetical protein CPB85DRAFT_1312106 [Mucidula mucida]
MKTIASSPIKGLPVHAHLAVLSPQTPFTVASMSMPSGSNISRRPRRLKALPSLVLREKEDPSASESDYDDNDPTDLTYVPTRSKIATPKRRTGKKQRRDPGLKDRANAEADPPNTCVLTGEKNVFGRVQAAHGMARNLSYRRPNLMTNLEYYFGFDPETLCLDTRHNIWFANASDHIDGDRGAFGTLPLLDDLTTVCDTAGDNTELSLDSRVPYITKWKPTGGGRQFTYSHLSFRYTADTAPLITYRDPVPDSNGERRITVYQFPYRNLQFKSFLHIVFAIVDLWLKYDKYGKQDFWDDDERARMDIVAEIMSIWLVDPPEEFLELAPATKAALAEAKARAEAEHDNEDDGPETPSKIPKPRENGVAVDVVDSKDLTYGYQNAGKVAEDGAAPPAGPSKVDKGKGKAVDRDDPSPPTERATRQPADAGTSTAHPSTSGAAVPEHDDVEQPAVAPEGPAPTKGRKPKAPRASGVGRKPAQKREREREESDDEYKEARHPRKQARKSKAPKPDEAEESAAGPSNGRKAQPASKKARR